jgi:hypothetical protein
MAKTKISGEYLKDSVVRFTAKAGENITKGQAVYISGISGEVPVVSLADADDTNKMPAFGLAESTVSTNESVEVTSNGTLAGIDTSSYALGDILYISTTAGSLTNDPSGLEASKVQNIGMVQRVHASNGSIKVGGAGRTNATPNLNDGNIFVGNSSNKSVSDAFTDVLNDQAGINSSANATAITIDSSENVGIGTSSPTADLSVGSTSTSSGDVHLRTTKTAFSITPSNTDAGGILLDLGWVNGGQGPMKFGIGSAEKMRIDSSGNVGIGTSSPSAKLTVAGGSDMGIRIISDADGYASLQFGDVDDSVRGGITYNSADDSLQLRGYNNTERMRIDSSGNVGIGTDSPNSTAGFTTLTLNNATSGGIIDFENNTSLVGRIYNTSTNFHVYNQTANSLLFGTGGAEKMRIDSSGNLLVGTTSTSASVAGGRIFSTGRLVTSVNNEGHYFRRNSSDGAIVDFAIDSSTVGSIVSRAGLVSSIVLDPRASGAGLTGTSDAILPTEQTGTPTNNNIDLGNSTLRWKDLYLGGGVYVGGTGSANHLDDYEEGTWTPAISGATHTVQQGFYTKVGDLVFFKLRIAWSAYNNAAGGVLTGLPFTADAAIESMGVNVYVNSGFGSIPSGKGYLNAYVASNNTTLNFNWQPNTAVAEFAGSGNIYVAGTYLT